MKFDKEELFKRHWLMIVVALFLCALVAGFVDLKPQVSENFFFSSSDPQFQEDAKIDRMFGSDSQMIVSVAGEISSARYLDRLGQITRQIESIKGVSSVNSLTEGPKNFEDAVLEATADCGRPQVQQRSGVCGQGKHPGVDRAAGGDSR